MRFLALLSLFLLSACSYDPYHYYYDCDNTSFKGDQYYNDYHLHHKTVEYLPSGEIYDWLSESATSTTYQLLVPYEYEDDFYSYRLRFNKVDGINNRLPTDTKMLRVTYDKNEEVVSSIIVSCTAKRQIFESSSFPFKI